MSNNKFTNRTDLPVPEGPRISDLVGSVYNCGYFDCLHVYSAVFIGTILGTNGGMLYIILAYIKC